MIYTRPITSSRAWRRRPWRAVCFFLAVALVAACADARFAEIRRVTQTESTGNCVGDPRTPLCAVETQLACWVRRDPRLCEIVGAPPNSVPDKSWVRVEYILMKQSTLHPEDIRPELKGLDWHKPGIEELELIMREYDAKGLLYPHLGWQPYWASIDCSGGKCVIPGWVGNVEEGDDELPKEK